jgi:P4 family phage/plasmid primase-like protien
MIHESTMSVKYKDLSEFLAKHSAKNNNNKNENPTHTRIPDKKLNVYGGSYIIPNEELSTFYKLYHEHVFINKNKEYLTEKQLEYGGAMAVDFDFRYNHDVTTKQHTKEHIQDMVVSYLEELKNFFLFKDNTPFDVFVFEKPNVNQLADKSLTKDGIHLIIGLQVDFIVQQMIRDKMITLLPECWDLPLINDFNSVLDEGISKGSINWQLFGSRKPGNEAYELLQHFIVTYDSNDTEFMMDEIKVESFDLKNHFYKLSVRNHLNPKFEFNPKMQNEYNIKKGNKPQKTKRPNSKTKMNLLIDDENDEDSFTIENIKCKETLEKAVNIMIKSFNTNEHELLEIHKYTQVLPERFYEPGSHLINRQVAFALKHTDERLFLSWILLRSKAADFKYDDIIDLHNTWKKFSKSNKTKESVTKKSIMYWVKQYNFEGFLEVKKESIDFAIEESLTTQTEYDKAQVLKQMYKDKYVCVSYEKKGIWYVFKNHRWVLDRGLSLREAISKSMYDIYSKKSEHLNNEWYHYDPTDDRAEFIKKKIKIIGEIMITLKKTNDKNNILREAMELFYDGEFIKHMNNKKHLLCFNNGVVDFKEKQFRDGYPDDYITKTTNIDYINYNDIQSNEEHKLNMQNCTEFMEKLFPIDALNKYMWDHLAATLIGHNKNQTFNVYHGCGSNGKSILTDLMSVTLGEYKGTVPITLVTEKRGLIGGTSDEVLKLKGVRYAVMQEPSKGVKLNEGIMKELTGGDPIQARGLYSESEIFEPQFSLVVCTNNLFDIDSNDDGTWRRIRKCDFVSKFVDKPDDYSDDIKYVFEKDKSLKDKLPLIAPIFASMLVKRAFITDGIVEDCAIVMQASNEYRKGQDFIAAFVSENIEKTNNPKDRIKKTEVASHFKIWFQQEQGNRKMPKGQELYDYMDTKLCLHKSTGWHGYKIKYQDNLDELDELEL